MYLLVRLTSYPQGSADTYSLEFVSDVAALQALATMQNTVAGTVTVENERGELISVLRSAIESAWLTNEMPPHHERSPSVDHSSLPEERGMLLARLGKPAYEGPDAFGYLQTRVGPLQDAVGIGRLMIWRCNEDSNDQRMCIAENDGRSEAWQYRACKLHEQRASA